MRVLYAPYADHLQILMAFRTATKMARQAIQVARPSVHGHVGEGLVRESQSDPGHRCHNRPDRTEGGFRLRIESFEGLRETSIPFRLDRPEEILRTSRIRRADLRRRLIEV